MPVDPQVQQILDESAGRPPPQTLTPDEARIEMRGAVESIPRPDVVASAVDREIPGVAGDLPVRVYTPRGDGPFPVTAFFHGGGWVIGDLETHDNMCRLLCEATRSVIVSVHYRRAPEHKFPAAADDCFAATVWTAENAEELGGDPSKLIVGGDSAGGNLATVVALQAREKGHPHVAFQLLIYPVIDCDFNTPSYLENATGYGLTREAMQWFFRHYVANEAEATQPYVSPLRASNLAGLPPAYVLTAEYDPLRDEGEAYARRLEEAGVPVTLERFPGMHHGFARMTHRIDRAQGIFRRIREEMDKVL